MVGAFEKSTFYLGRTLSNFGTDHCPDLVKDLVELKQLFFNISILLYFKYLIKFLQCSQSVRCRLFQIVHKLCLIFFRRGGFHKGQQAENVSNG